MKEQYKLYKGDCLEVMDQLIEQGIEVDAVICDPPYGTTACKWDSVIPFDEMWKRLNKLIKDNGAIILFATQPFSASLINSNIKGFKHEWIWQKEKGVGILLICEDLDQLCAISDRVMVLHDGKNMGIINPHKVSKNTIGLMMMGKNDVLNEEDSSSNEEGVQI